MKINRKIFKEYDIRGKYPEEINDRTAYVLGLAFSKLAKAKKIVIGRDARKESEKVFWPLVAGLVKGGLEVADLGVCATPELFFAVGAKKFKGGVMVTASHSPKGQTGFKFCDEKGRVFGFATGNEKLAKAAKREMGRLSTGVNLQAQSKNIDFLSIAGDYKKFALSFIKPNDVSGFNMVIDASGGSGSRLAEVIFDALPLKFYPVNFRAESDSGGHGPNPLLIENQREAKELVSSKRADLGVIFDGDADRAVFIDELGRFVQPYYINCLLAQIVLSMKKGATIVADARLQLAIAKTVKDSGGKLLVHRSGYANFIRTMTRSNQLFGCENSGHIMYNFRWKKKQRFVYGDAIISILLILKYLKRNKIRLSEAVKPFMDAYAVSGELNFDTGRFEQIAAAAKKAFPQAKFSSIDGLSAIAKDRSWFFNIRQSNTEPVIRLNVEAATPVLEEKIRRQVIELI